MKNYPKLTKVIHSNDLPEEEIVGDDHVWQIPSKCFSSTWLKLKPNWRENYRTPVGICEWGPSEFLNFKVEVLNTNPEQVLFRDDLLFSIVIDVKENHKGAKVALKTLPLQKRYEIASVGLLCYQTLICFFMCAIRAYAWIDP